MATVIVIIAATTAWISAVPNDPQEALQAAIVTVEHQEQLLMCFEVDYTMSAPAVSVATPRRPFIRAAQASALKELRGPGKYRTRSKLQIDLARPEDSETTENGFDGAQYRQFDVDGQFGAISSDQGHDVSYFRYIYGDNRQLSEMLKAVAAAGEVQWLQVHDRRVLECRLVEPQQLTLTLDLDPANQWQPRLIRKDQVVPPGLFPDERSREVLVLETRAFIKQAGVVVPSDVAYKQTAVTGQGAETTVNEIRYAVQRLKVRERIEDAEFVIAFPEGTRVADRDRDIGYTVGDAGSEHPLHRGRSAARVDGGADGPRSGGVWFWWADRRIWLALGLLVILAIGYLRWKQAGV